MKIILLASNPELYSNQRIMEAGKRAGHIMEFVSIKDCYMNICASTPEIHYQGRSLNDAEAIIPRIRPSITFYGAAVVRQFETMGVYCLNDSVAISRSRDKLRSLQMMSRRQIGMPITGFAHSAAQTKDLINMVGGAPLIIKLLEGTQGKGVVLAETNKAAESVINAFKCMKVHILVQEFIKEANGSDIRCFVIGEKVVAAMERRAAPGDFRANLHADGKAFSVDITDEEREIALKATKIMGLKVAGVDLIRSSSGPKILEINSSPGLEGIEGVSKVDIAGLMIRQIEEDMGLLQGN